MYYTSAMLHESDIDETETVLTALEAVVDGIVAGALGLPIEARTGHVVERVEKLRRHYVERFSGDSEGLELALSLAARIEEWALIRVAKNEATEQSGQA